MVKGDTIRSRGTGSYPNLREEVARLIADDLSGHRLMVDSGPSVSIDEFIRRAKKGCATNYGGDPMKFEAKLEELRRLQERDGK